MLRAYDYTENTAGRSALQASQSFNQELKLAKAAVGRALQLETEGPAQCPGCGGKEHTLFFEKWGVAYLRCGNCGSVFADVDNETLKAYQEDAVLSDFRSSSTYQQEAKEKRELSWQEILDWMQFRCFRYLGRNQGLRIFSGGERYAGFAEMMRSSPLCGNLTVYQQGETGDGTFEIAVSFNLLQQSNHPREHLRMLNRHLMPGGLLFLSARLGTGFDILVLREHAQVYPYEYVSLLSRQGLSHILAQAGFEMLDYSTPGHMDVGYVQSKRAFIHEDNLFVRNLISDSDQIILGEFQRFLQKSGMSSYAHIVAKKVSGQ